ncbi:MAG TPA: hypothetical protein VFP12_13670 [Allosphingosinicella sp.]|nr:hypothetical protein [Allosphingosinicella sp.]
MGFDDLLVVVDITPEPDSGDIEIYVVAAPGTGIDRFAEAERLPSSGDLDSIDETVREAESRACSAPKASLRAHSRNDLATRQAWLRDGCPEAVRSKRACLGEERR